MIDSGYIRNEIYPLLRHDLEHYTKVVPIERWAECILGISQSWETCLRNQHLLIDPVITKSMECSCTAKFDKDRHDSWAMVVNRINTISRKLQNIPQTSLSDLFFVRNYQSIVDRDGPHYAQPDVLIVQNSTLSGCQRKRQAIAHGTMSSLVSILQGKAVSP